MELDAFDVRHSRYNWFNGVSAREEAKAENAEERNAISHF
jgi:hypothetical protein